MSAYDKNLIKNISQALERGSLREQASRVNSMVSVVSDFVNNLQEAKSAIGSQSEKKRESDQLRRQKELSPENKQRAEELIQELADIRRLEAQYNKSRQEVKSLESSLESLVREIRKI